jgi:hypothetical protein
MNPNQQRSKRRDLNADVPEVNIAGKEARDSYRNHERIAHSWPRDEPYR